MNLKTNSSPIPNTNPIFRTLAMPKNKDSEIHETSLLLTRQQPNPRFTNNVIEQIGRITNEENLSYTQRSTIDLIQQVLNSRLNTYQEFKNINDLFRIYKNVLKSRTSPEFELSMQRSENSVIELDIKKSSIEQLIPNNLDSFLIIPILSRGHLFSAVIRNRDNDFVVTVVNKGSREPNCPQFVEYTMKKEKLFEVLKTLAEHPHIPIPAVYKELGRNSLKAYGLKIFNRSQKIGNCFIKEPENAIKFALATRKFSAGQFESLRKVPQKIKWDIPTIEIHKQFVDEHCKENKSLSNMLKAEFKAYATNKTFRKALKDNIPEKALVIAFDPKNTTENLSKPERIKTLLENVNYDSVLQKGSQLMRLATHTSDASYINLFKELISTAGKTRDMMLSLDRREQFENLLAMFVNGDSFLVKTKNLLEKSSKYFPNVASQVKMDYHISYLSAGVNSLIRENYKDALTKLDFAIDMYAFNSPAYLFKGITYLSQNNKEKALENINHALKLKPNDTLALLALDEINKNNVSKNSILKKIIEKINQSFAIDNNKNEKVISREISQ